MQTGMGRIDPPRQRWTLEEATRSQAGIRPGLSAPGLPTPRNRCRPHHPQRRRPDTAIRVVKPRKPLPPTSFREDPRRCAARQGATTMSMRHNRRSGGWRSIRAGRQTLLRPGVFSRVCTTSSHGGSSRPTAPEARGSASQMSTLEARIVASSVSRSAGAAAGRPPRTPGHHATQRFCASA